MIVKTLHNVLNTSELVLKSVFEKWPFSQSARLQGMLTLCCYTLCYPHDELTLKELSYKLVMLLALLSGQRCQTLHCLFVSSVKMSDSKCAFTVDVLLKQPRKGKHLASLEFLAFTQIEKLCIVSVSKECLRRTKEIRGNEHKLLLSYQAPLNPVSTDTLARRPRDVLNGGGADTQQFGAHS